jgi:hypothetical protein
VYLVAVQERRKKQPLHHRANEGISSSVCLRHKEVLQDEVAVNADGPLFLRSFFGVKGKEQHGRFKHPTRWTSRCELDCPERISGIVSDSSLFCWRGSAFAVPVPS